MSKKKKKKKKLTEQEKQRRQKKLNEVVRKSSNAFKVVRIMLSIIGAVIGSALFIALCWGAVRIIQGIRSWA